MIRILHMIGSLELGGSQTMVMNLYRYIDKNNIQFDFILDHPDCLYYAEEIKQLGGRIYFLPGFKGTNILELKAAWNSFFDEHSEYTILHSHVRSYASLYLPIAKKHGLCTIIHSHSTSNGSGLSACVKAILQYPLRFQADYFFGCSKEAGRWLFGDKVINGDHYFMLQNAIDLKKYLPNEAVRIKYRREINANGETKVFIHVGRLHEAKNHLFLLELFSNYQKKHNNALLVLVGDGDLRTIIEDKIDELGIKKNVRMLGARNDVPNWLKAADCFLFPSNWEGLPVTVVEAQAAGLPCLISDNVTRDVNVSDLVKDLPIDKGTDLWVKAIENLDFKRRNVFREIKKAGFDVQNTAKWISEFYMGLEK